MSILVARASGAENEPDSYNLNKAKDLDGDGAVCEDAARKNRNVKGYKIEPAANLKGANLRGAYLRSVNLRGALMTDSDMTSANLIGADIYGAILTNAIMPDGKIHG